MITKPYFSAVWNVDFLLQYFERQNENTLQPYKKWTQKLLVLLLLIGKYRRSAFFKLGSMILSDLSYFILPKSVLKYLHKFQWGAFLDKELCYI